MNLGAAGAGGSLRRRVLLAAGGLGFAAMITQLVLMRELLAAFSGNELVFGISLAAWLLLTGGGAWVGRVAEPWLAQPVENATQQPARTSRLVAVVSAGLVIAALLPFAELIALRGLRDVVFARGAAVDVVETTAACLAVLAPFCTVSGALLTLTCGLLAESGESGSIGTVYAADSVGAVVGGAVFTFALAPAVDHFALLGAGAAAALAATAGLAWHLATKGLIAAAVAAAALVAGIFVWHGDEITTGWQYPGEIVVRSSSAYGRLVVTREDGRLTFFNNGVPIGTSDDRSAVEETVHYAMAQRPDAHRVLIVGGAATGAAREVLRYPAVAVTCIELDPAILAAAVRLVPDNGDSRLRFLTGDARRFVQRTTERFDVVLLDLPAPSTLQLNRFFTVEFFTGVKHVLRRDGVLAFGLGHYENFVGDDLADVLASADRTLRRVFGAVRVVPGGKVYFLASDGRVDADIAQTLEERDVATQLVNRHFLDAMLAPDRIADMERAIARPAAVNRDFDPVLYYRQIRHWLAQFGAPSLAVELVLLVGLAGYFVLLPAVPRLIFAAGFAGSALEVVMLLAFQVCFGALYQQVGLVVAVFMAGLAGGAAWATRRAGGEDATRILARLGWVTGGLAAALAMVPSLVGAGAATIPWVGQAALLGSTAAVGACVGAQFPLAGAASAGGTTRIAARLFGADLLGASAGALLVSAWLIPGIGVAAVCLLIAALNFVAAALLWWRTPRAA
jgi:spermidine synthase